MTLIRKVIPKENYCIEVILENENTIIINMKSKLETVRFGLLANKNFFNEASTDGKCIKWGNKVEISLSEIFQLAQK